MKLLEKAKRLVADQFPLTELPEVTMGEVLTIAGESAYDVVNEMLNARFGGGNWAEMQLLIDLYDCDALVAIIQSNFHEFFARKDKSAARRFIVLVQLAFRRVIQLPRCLELDVLKIKVRECLGEVQISKQRYLELVFSQKGFLVANLLKDHSSNIRLYRVALACLLDVPFEGWPKKGSVLLRILRIVPNWSHFAQLLSRSRDLKTKLVGHAFFQISTMELTPRERTKKVMELGKFLPEIDLDAYKTLFKFSPLPLVLEETIPNVAFRVSFTTSREVFIHKNLIIGRNVDAPLQTLTAYDRETRQLVWQMTLLDDSIDCQLHPMGIALILRKKREMVFIHPETGGVIKKIDLCFDIQPQTRIYLTRCGCCFVRNKAVNHGYDFSGAEIKDGCYRLTFQSSLPLGPVQFLDRWIGIRRPVSGVVILDQEGNQHILSECRSVFFRDNTFYTLNESEDGNHSIIIYRTLAFHALRNINLGIKGPVRMRDVCDDGTSICQIGTVFFFVEPSGNVIVVKKRIEAREIFIDRRKGTIWTWDFQTKEVWKHRKSDSEYLGILNHLALHFLDVDDKERLYYTDYKNF